MTSKPAIQTLGIVMIVGSLIGLAGALQAFSAERYPPPAATKESLEITSPTVLRHLAMGYSTLAADLYWIRTIQYYGGTKLVLDGATANRQGSPGQQAGNDYELLYPMLDLTTTLDPRFNIAYRFGAIYLAEPYPIGANRPDLAQALLEKGLRARPDKWEYLQDIGFVHYWWRHDYRAAAEWFTKASDVPGSPWWMKSLAATTLAQGGDRQSSRVMWESIRDSAEIDWLKEDAERRLAQLNALDQIDALQAKIDEFAAKNQDG